MSVAKSPRTAGQSGAAYFGREVPDSVFTEILIRLPAKSVIRSRAVCRAWRNHTSAPHFLLEYHLCQQPRPLLCLILAACPATSYLQLADYCVEALDLRSDELRSIIRFTDNKYRNDDDDDKYVPFGVDGNVDGEDGVVSDDDGDENANAPADDEDREDGDEDEDEDDAERDMLLLAVHASVDGLLLISFVDRWYVCNPVTRQWAPLPTLDYREVAGLYAHDPSGEYRVLYYKGAEDEDAETCYYILTVGSQEGRSIGCPISPELEAEEDPKGEQPEQGLEDMGLAIGLEEAFRQPPALVCHNLHWPPQERQSYHILVFDTVAEVFRWMNPPVRNSNMRLLEMEGKLAMSVSGEGEQRVELWLLEDYLNEIWVRKYWIELPVAEITSLGYQGGWHSFVVSLEGDVLVECPRQLLHCDRNGNLLKKFWCSGHWQTATTHLLKESLLPHAIFQTQRDDDVQEPPFFQGL